MLKSLDGLLDGRSGVVNKILKVNMETIESSTAKCAHAY
jgi:hypothetical protein